MNEEEQRDILGQFLSEKWEDLFIKEQDALIEEHKRNLAEATRSGLKKFPDRPRLEKALENQRLYEEFLAAVNRIPPYKPEAEKNLGKPEPAKSF